MVGSFLEYMHNQQPNSIDIILISFQTYQETGDPPSTASC